MLAVGYNVRLVILISLYGHKDNKWPISGDDTTDKVIFVEM